jgi:uridine kinase
MEGSMSVSKSVSIRETQASPTVQIHLPDKRVIEGPRGLQLEAFLKDRLETEAPIVGAIVNGDLRELTYPIVVESNVHPISMAAPDGMRIYRRSLTFLLAAVFESLFPKARLNVDHSVASGGYYCRVSGRDELTQDDLDQLEARMREWVEADLPFSKSQVTLEEAIQNFEKRGYDDKVRLLTHRKKPHLIMYQLEQYRDYHHGYMVPSTGYLQWFALALAEYGFTLRFPRRHRPVELLSPPNYPKLLDTFLRYGNWLETLGVSHIGSLNRAITTGRTREIILVSEALHERRIAEIAALIAVKDPLPRIVLIAGPSASGKTTFSKRLSIQLLALGLSPLPVELDSFFVDRERTPRDESGDFNYEALEALDLERLNHVLAGLIQGKSIRMPKFDFIAGRQSEGDLVQLQPDQIIILEGIHGLNPDLLSEIPPPQSFRIYASALTQLNLDRYNRVSTTDTRLIRRIVRDASRRGYSAAETIQRWESVRRGERTNIYPFQENADVMFNSALVYEGAALAPIAEPLLRQVPFGTPEHVEAKRLLTFLGWFLPLNTELIPDNSILREFIGGSILAEFVPWQSPES